MNEARKEVLEASFALAQAEHRLRYLSGDPMASDQYIFDSQKEFAMAVVREFGAYQIVSAVKRTKTGMDGVLIYLAYQMALHHTPTVRILTGMSNVKWAAEMCAKIPSCFKACVHHHGKLGEANLEGIRDALIMVDEIDTGDKSMQVLERTFQAANLFDLDDLRARNIKLFFVSATMFRELKALEKCPCHVSLHMPAAPNYLSHRDFLDRGIIQEYYDLSGAEAATKWLREDVLGYGSDFRVHICRIRDSDAMRNACAALGVDFRPWTSACPLSDEEMHALFTVKTRHVVLAIKGFCRRATLLPNPWKLAVGATHELWTPVVNYWVQVQGLPGRLTGYWKHHLDAGHKTGPYRCSVRAIEEYEARMTKDIESSRGGTMISRFLGEPPCINDIFEMPLASFIELYFNYEGLVVEYRPQDHPDETTLPFTRGSAFNQVVVIDNFDYYNHLHRASVKKTPTRLFISQKRPNTYNVVHHKTRPVSHAVLTTSVKVLPAPTTDYLKGTPYRITGSTVVYSVLKDAPLPPTYSWKTVDGKILKNY